VGIADFHVPLAGSQPSKGCFDHRSATRCSSSYCENAADYTIAWRDRGQIEAREIDWGLLKHHLAQRSEAFLVR